MMEESHDDESHEEKGHHSSSHKKTVTGGEFCPIMITFHYIARDRKIFNRWPVSQSVCAMHLLDVSPGLDDLNSMYRSVQYYSTGLEICSFRLSTPNPNA